MKKILKILLVVISFLISCVCLEIVSIAGDVPDTLKTIYLKDGTVIECDRGWINGDIL